MAIIAGIDEAGYGPTLGPMVITIVIFDVPDKTANGSLWDLLKDAVSNDVKNKKQRLAVGDSKKLYNAQKGLKLLEEAVLSFLWLQNPQCNSFCQLLSSLSAYNAQALANYPWYADKDYPIPLATNISAILNYMDLLKCTLDNNGVRICGVHSCVVTVAEFNEQVRRAGSKSAVLFNNCAVLISALWNGFKGNINLVVDKQGGRSSYSELLKNRLSLTNVEILQESSKISTYVITDTQRKMKVSFVEKGEETNMATALASMFSKYIRELFMHLENQYWLKFIPDLKPTAGYYTDAQRFLSQIAYVRKKEAIRDDILIRIK